MEEIDGVALDVGAIERVDRHQGDLRVSLLINLGADVLDLRFRLRIKHMGEVIDVSGRF